MTSHSSQLTTHIPPSNEVSSQINETTPCADNPNFQYKKHGCPYCSYRSISSYVLRRHISRKHKKEDEAKNKLGQIIQSPQSSSSNLDDDDLSTLDVHNIQFEEYFKIFISGPSKSGKSYFIGQLLSNLSAVTKKTPLKIIYIFKHWQQKLMEIRELNLVDVFLQGGDDLQRRLSKLTGNGECLIIFDDQMNNSEGLAFIADLFSVEARHTKMSLIFISQKIFFNDDNLRKIRENSDYFILFKNPKNINSISLLSRQMTENSTLANIFSSATEKPHSYLLIDTRQEAKPETRFLSNLFDRSHLVTSWVVDITMNNKYKRKTNFNRMILISADKLAEMTKNDERGEMENEDNVADNENITPIVQGGNVLPPAKMSTSEKRKRSQDEEDEEEKEEPSAQRIKMNTPLTGMDNVQSSPIRIIEPPETVHIVSEKRKRDIGLGMDDDAEKAKRRKVENQEEGETEPIQHTDGKRKRDIEDEDDDDHPSQRRRIEGQDVEKVSEPITETVIPAAEEHSTTVANKCELCERSFASARGLKQHTTRKHPSSKRVEVLDQDDIDDLARKKSLENDEGHSSCKICRKHFKSERLFDKHVRDAHINVKPERIANGLEDDNNLESRQRKNRKKAALNKKIQQKRGKVGKYDGNTVDDVADSDDSYSPTNVTKVCNLCHQSFTTDKELKKHFISKHSNNH